MKKEKLNIALIQSQLKWEDKRNNLASFEKKIMKVNGADIIILPEMFTTGFSMHNEAYGEVWEGSYTRWWMQEIALRTGSDIIGSFIVKEGDNYYNRLVWATPQGTDYHYDKRHLFSLAGEHNHYTAGQERKVIERYGWRIMPLVCYDVRFPVWSRNDQEIDAYIYIANFPAKRKSAWENLLKARSIENQAYTIGVNIVGKDGNDIEYNGGSYLFNYNGEVLVDCESASAIHSGVMDKIELISFRKKFNFLQDQDNFTVIT